VDDELDDIDVHFPPADGELTLTCGDRAFDRLWSLVADSAGPIEGAPSVMHVIVIERRPPSPPKFHWFHTLGTLGCAILGFIVMFPFIVGVLTIVGWLR
jgi:hypothetical protein